MTRPIHPLMVDTSAMAYVAQAAFPACKATFDQNYSTGPAPLDTTAIAGSLNLIQARTKAIQNILIQQAADSHGVDRADVINNLEDYGVAKVMPVLVYDHTKPTFRHIKEPAYKAQREQSEQAKPTTDAAGLPVAPMKELVRTQLAKLSEFAYLLGIPQVYSQNAEADDIAYQLTRLFKNKGISSTLLTVDTDWMLGVTEGVAWHSLTNKIPKPVRESARAAAFDQAVEAVFELYRSMDAEKVDSYTEAADLAASMHVSENDLPADFSSASKTMLRTVTHIRDAASLGDPFAKHLVACAQTEGLVTLSNKVHVDYARAHLIVNELPEYNQPDQGWIQGHRHVTDENFSTVTGYPTPGKQVLAKILEGDSADNLSGVSGIGPEKARHFVQKYDSAAAFYLKCISEPAFEEELRNPKLRSAETAVERMLLTENGYRMFDHARQLIDLAQAPIVENLKVEVKPQGQAEVDANNVYESVLMLGIAPTLLNLNRDLMPDLKILQNPSVLNPKVSRWVDQAVDASLASSLAATEELTNLLRECQSELVQLREDNPEFGVDYRSEPLNLVPVVVTPKVKKTKALP